MTIEPEDLEPVVSRARELEETEMDMTPMVDVTFNLLIFFMVTASFSMQKSLPVPAPNTNQPSANATQEQIEDDPDIIVVRIDEYNTFHVVAAHWDEEREAPSEQDLLVALGDARSVGTPPTKLYVIAHGDATHEKVVMAMDAGSTMGMAEVKLMTVEDEG